MSQKPKEPNHRNLATPNVVSITPKVHPNRRGGAPKPVFVCSPAGIVPTPAPPQQKSATSNKKK